MEIGVNRGPPPGPPQNYQQTLPPTQGYQTQGSYPQEGFYQVHSPPQGMPRAPHNMTRNPHAMGMPQQPMPSPNPSLPYPKGPRMMYNNPTGQTQGMINQGGPYPAKGLYVNEAQQGYMHQAGGMVFSPNGIHQQAGQQTRYNIQCLSPQGQFQGHMMYQGQGQMTAQQKQGMWYQEPSGMTSPPSGPVRFPGTRANGPMPMVSPTPTSHTPSPGQQMSRMMLSPNSQAQGVALGSHPHQQAQVVNQGSHAHPQGQIVGSHQLPQGQGINPGSHSHMQGQMVGPNQPPQGQMINPGSLPHPQGQMINPGSLPRQQAPVMNPGAHMQQYVMAQQRQHFSQHEQNLSPPQGMMGNNPSYRHQHYQYNQHAMQSNRHCRPPYVQIPMANQYNQSETPSIPYSQALESGYPSPGSTTSTPGPNIVNNAPSVSGVITDQSAMNYTSAKRGGSVYTMANTQALYTTTASSRTFVSPVLVKHSQETSQHLGPMSATPASNFMMVRGEMTPTTFAGPRHQPILISSSGHVIVSYPHQDIHTHQGPQSLQAMTRTSVTTLANTVTLPSSSAGSSMCTSQSPSSFTDSKHSISVASSLTHNETEQTACCGGSGSVVKSEHNKLSCSCASGNPSEHSSRFMVPASGVMTLLTSPSAVTTSPSGVMPSSLLTRSPDTEQWLNRMKQSHQMHNIDSKTAPMSSLVSTHSTVATGCCASSVSLPTRSDTPVGSSVMSGGRASVSPAISVPFAWRRELENGIVVYYSPSSSRLCSPTSVKEYLSSDGTCKCGLSCPLSVEKVFNFDPKVRSRPFFTEDIETTDDLNNLCNHKRKIIAMATLQKGNLQTSRALGAETQSASKVLEALSLSKKDVGKKKKTKVKGTGSSFDSSLANKIQMPEPSPVAMGPPASNPQSYPPLPNPMPHQTLAGEQPVETQSFLVASNSGSEIKMEGSPRLSTMPVHEGHHLNPAYKPHMQIEHSDKFQFANMTQFAHPARMHRPQNPFEMMAGLRQRMPQGGDATQGPMSFGQQGMMPVNQMFSFQLQMQAQAAAARNAGIAGGHRYGMPSPSLSNSSQQSSPSPGRIHNKMGDIVTPPPYYDQSSPSPNTIGPYRPVGGPRMMSPPEAMGLISPPMMPPDTSTPIPKKKKKKKKRDAANKAMSGLLDRNMPCPNVDVRQFTPRHMQSGSYAQASMASPPHSTPCFLDNPAAFLAHQAEMVSSKIQSTFTGDVAPPDSRPQKADTPKSGSVSSRPASVAGSMCSISEKCDSIVSEQDTLAGILSQDSSKGRQRQGTTSETSVCKTETNIETGNSTVGEFPASCLLSATARAQITPNRAPGPYPNTWTDPVAKRFRAPSRPAPIQHVPPGGKQIGGGSIVYHHNIENQQAFHEGGVVNGGGILMVSGPANRSDALLIPTSTILLPGSAEPKNNPELAPNPSTNDTAVIKSLLQSHIQQDQLQAKVSAMLMGSKESATPIQMVQNLISGIGGGGTAPSLVNVTRRMLNMGEGFGNMVGNPNSDNNQLINGYHPDTVINMAGPLGQNMAGPLGHNISMSAPLEQNTCGVNSGMPVMSVAMVTAVTDSITQSISSSSALPITPQSQACTTVQSSHHQHSHNASNTSDFSSKQQGHDDHNVNNTTDVKSSQQDPNHNANISAYVKPCDSSIEAQNLPEHPDSAEQHSFSNNDDKAVTDIGVGTTTDPASSKGRITKKKKKKKKGKKIKSLLADAIQSPSDCKNSHSIADPQEHNADNQHFVPLNTTMEESESTDLNTSGESVRSGLDYARGGLLINQPEPGEIIRQTAASSLILNQAQALQHTFLSGQDPQLAPMCINPSEAQSQLTLQGHTNIIQTVSFMPNMVAMDPNTGLVQSIQMPITSEHDNKDGRMESDQVSSLSQSHMVQTMMQSLQIQNNMLLQGMTPAGPYLQPLGNALIPIYPSPVQVSTSSEEGGLAMVQVGGTSTQLSPYINPPTRTSSNVVSTQTEAVQTEDSCSELIEGGGRLLEDNGEAVLADEEDLNESSLLHSEEASFTEQDDQSQNSYLEQDVPSHGPYAQEEDLSQGIQSENSADASTAEPNSAVDEASNSVASSHVDGPMEDSIRSSELNMDENSPVCKSLTPISSCTSSPVHSDTVTSRHDNVRPVVTRVEENDKASVLIKQERESLSTPVQEYTKGSIDSCASSGDSQDSIKSDPFTETREVLTGNSPSKSHSGISPRRTTSMPVLSREEPLVKEEITPRKITPAMLIIQKHVENSVKLVSDQEFEFDDTPTKELLDLRRRNLGLCSRTLNIQRNLEPSPQPIVESPPEDTRLNESLPPTLSVMKNSQVPPLKRRPVIRKKGRFQKKSKLKKLLRPKLKATIIENKLKPVDGELKPGDEVPKVPAIRIKVALNNNKLTVSDSSKEKSSVSSLDSHSDNQDIGVTKTENNPIGDSEPLSGVPQLPSGAPQLLSGAPQHLSGAPQPLKTSTSSGGSSDGEANQSSDSSQSNPRSEGDEIRCGNSPSIRCSNLLSSSPETSDLNCSGVLSPLDTQIYSDASRVNRGRKVSTHIKTRRSIRAELDDILPRRTAVKRSYPDKSLICDVADDRHSTSSSSPEPRSPRVFSVGDLIWGPIKNFPSWPGKLVPQADVPKNPKSENGKRWVRWFGTHSFSQVETQDLKTLTEGLEEHHSARMKQRKGRKMNSNLEAAIQEAMLELDRQTETQNNADDVSVVAMDTKVKSIKKKKVK